jgi:hypothetical protein
VDVGTEEFVYLILFLGVLRLFPSIKPISGTYDEQAINFGDISATTIDPARLLSWSSR